MECHTYLCLNEVKGVDTRMKDKSVKKSWSVAVYLAIFICGVLILPAKKIKAEPTSSSHWLITEEGFHLRVLDDTTTLETEIVANMEAEIVAYSGDSTCPIIPTEYVEETKVTNGENINPDFGHTIRKDIYKIVGIGEKAFYDRDRLTGIIIPHSVRYIGNQAFYDCDNLTDIRIPYSVTDIGDYTFSSCDKLASVTLPNGITRIGNEVFQGCYLLKDVVIPDSVTSIGDYAFWACGLTSVTIPDSVMSIGSKAFGALPLTSVMLPVNVSSIDANPFAECSSLREIFVDENNEYYLSENGVLYDKAKTILIGYPGDKEGAVKIPDGVVEIGNSAFYGCGSFEDITIPGSVLKIGDEAFYGTSFSDVLVDENNEFYTLENGILYDRAKTTLIVCPTAKTGVIMIPDSVVAIKESAFLKSCLTGVVVPDSVTHIGFLAFEQCGVMTVYGTAGSCAEDAARECNVPFSTGISPKNLYSCEVILAPSAFIFDGSEKTPEVTVNDGDKIPAEGVDYEVRYEDNLYTGTARVILTGKGGYAGTVVKEFLILEDPDFGKEDPDDGDENENRPVQKKDQILNGTKVYNKAYGSKMFRLNIKVTEGDGKLSYKTSDRNVAEVDSKGRVTIKGTGIAAITVTASETMNCKKSSIKVTVKVAPARQSIKSVKTAKGRNMTVQWKKDQRASGYQVQYSTDKKFKRGVKTKWVERYNTSSKKFTKLTVGKRYYVKVRAYKNIKINGKSKKLFGAWSREKRSGSIID